MEECIVPFDKSKYTMITSLLLIIPSIYSYYCQLYLYALVLLITSVISANYWRKATDGWRRILDLICAKATFLLFAFAGLWYVRDSAHAIAGYTILILLCYVYYKSHSYYKNKDKHNEWLKYHTLFHILSCFEFMIIIDSIYNYTKI